MSVLALVRAFWYWVCPLCGCHDDDAAEACVYCLPDGM